MIFAENFPSRWTLDFLSIIMPDDCAVTICGPWSMSEELSMSDVKMESSASSSCSSSQNKYSQMFTQMRMGGPIIASRSKVVRIRYLTQTICGLYSCSQYLGSCNYWDFTYQFFYFRHPVRRQAVAIGAENGSGLACHSSQYPRKRSCARNGLSTRKRTNCSTDP